MKHLLTKFGEFILYVLDKFVDYLQKKTGVKSIVKGEK